MVPHIDFQLCLLYTAVTITGHSVSTGMSNDKTAIVDNIIAPFPTFHVQILVLLCDKTLTGKGRSKCKRAKQRLMQH
jgi:hypothetical protein